jgi:hypothetical protein
MKKAPTPAEINALFDNNDPVIAWSKATDIIRRINPGYDFTLIQSVRDDVFRLFHGEYPGYCAISTLYHDLPHTLAALLCGARLMHGVHLSGDLLSDEEITLIMIAILMHDVGYAQRIGEEGGTGAQYTQTHVQRGIEFMQKYFSERELPVDMRALATMILGTEHPRPFAQIEFGDERVRMLASIVATGDIAGQMADRVYLEKLLLLFLEFREAKFGNYKDMYELLCKTSNFYESVRKKLDGALGGIHQKLSLHFKETMGVDNNFYLESIEKNIAYLSKVVSRDEKKFFTTLKRNGISEKSRTLI